MKKHGKSFHWASRLLGRRHAERAARLYAFCRRLDDLVDEGSAESAGFALRSIAKQLAGEREPEPWIEDFRRLTRGTRATPDYVDQFVAGLATDVGPVRMEDLDDLVRYCYGVAGAVGLLMCGALDVPDPKALPFAIDLGVAMQLTNLCRDVLEDARRDRLYLPRSLVGRRVTPAAIVDGDAGARRGAEHAIHVLLDLADRYYRSADRGMCFLPWRARLAILTAGRVYESIGPRIRRRLAARAYWGSRAYVPRAGKLRHTARAIGALLLSPAYWQWFSSPDHRPALHRALRGLPGAAA